MKTILVALIVFLILPSLALPAAASHWSHSAGFTLDSSLPAPLARFTFTVRNTASGSLDVYFVNVHFCWQPSGVAYYLKEDDGTTVSIPGGAAHDFARTIVVNTTALSNCAWEAQVRGKAVGDQDAYTATYGGSVSVNSRASFVTAITWGLLALVGGVVVVVIIILVLLVLLLGRGHTPSAPLPPRTSPPATSQTSMPTPPPGPPARAYCAKCGAPLPPGAAFCAACGARVG